MEYFSDLTEEVYFSLIRTLINKNLLNLPTANMETYYFKLLFYGLEIKV